MPTTVFALSMDEIKALASLRQIKKYFLGLNGRARLNMSKTWDFQTETLPPWRSG
jgi:hypothetical protein